MTVSEFGIIYCINDFLIQLMNVPRKPNHAYLNQLAFVPAI